MIIRIKNLLSLTLLFYILKVGTFKSLFSSYPKKPLKLSLWKNDIYTLKKNDDIYLGRKYLLNIDNGGTVLIERESVLSSKCINLMPPP